MCCILILAALANWPVVIFPLLHVLYTNPCCTGQCRCPPVALLYTNSGYTGQLADGNISENVIQCKFHLWEFDTRTECAIENPTIKVRSYPVKLQDDIVYIDVPAVRDKT